MNAMNTINHSSSHLETSARSDSRAIASEHDAENIEPQSAAVEFLAVSPVLELASVCFNDAVPSANWREKRSEELKQRVDHLLATLMQFMSSAECLVVRFGVSTTSDGNSTISTRLRVEEAANWPTPSLHVERKAFWQAAMQTCAVPLFDRVALKVIEDAHEPARLQPVALPIERVSVQLGTGMGFSAAPQSPKTLHLPRLTSQFDGFTWGHTVDRSLATAVAFGSTICLGYRMSPVDAEELQLGANTNIAALSLDSCALTSGQLVAHTYESFHCHSGPFLRIVPFVELNSREVGADGRAYLYRLAPLLEMFVQEVLPGHHLNVDGLLTAASSSRAFKSIEIDLTNIVPFKRTYPPILPSIEILSRTAFPYHMPVASLKYFANGLEIGYSRSNAGTKPICIPQSDRSSHIWIMGATGTGKTTLIQNLIMQDIEEGRGLMLLDPHGDLYEQLVKGGIPQGRTGDIVYMDPGARPDGVSLNPFGLRDDLTAMKVNRLIGDLLEMFSEMYDMSAAGGPGFELYFRNVMLAASTAQVESSRSKYQGPTLRTFMSALHDKELLGELASNAHKSFLGEDLGSELAEWYLNSMRATGEQRFDNWINYVSSKMNRVMSNPVVRTLLCNHLEPFNFRKAMDERKVVLVNLSKGALGPLDTKFIGMLLTRQVLSAALSRADQVSEERIPFTYYLDEFQNFVSDDLEQMLAESRKYRLQLVLANQTLGQLKAGKTKQITNALIGNTGAKIFFRLGIKEAAELEEQVLPAFDRDSLSRLPNHVAVAKLLIDGSPSEPLAFHTQASSGP